MQNFEVLSKGNYLRPQAFSRVTACRYLFVREGEKNYILIEFCNNGDDVLRELRFTLTQYDADGEMLRRQNVASASLEAGAGKKFVFEKIEAHPDCVDFSVENMSARCGYYVYSLIDGNAVTEYAEEEPAPVRTARIKSGEIKGFTVTVKRPKYPVAIGIFMCATLLCLILCIVLSLDAFKHNNFVFVKNGVEYAFVGDINEAGSDIYVSGYRVNKENVVIPDEIDGHPVVYVGHGAFRGNVHIRNIRFEGKIDIEQDAFDGCSNLESVNFENVISVGHNAFRDCISLREVRSSSLEKIEGYAFENCDDLQTVEITRSRDLQWIELGDCAFSNCRSLKTIRIEPLIDYPDFFGSSLFYNCYFTENVYLHNFQYFGETPGEVSDYDSLSLVFGGVAPKNSLHTLHIENMDCIPEYFCEGYSNLCSVTVGHLTSPVVGKYAFSSCVSLSEIDLPTITEVHEGAFTETKLSSFDGRSLTSIGDSAFAFCSELESFDLSENRSLTNVGAWVFEGCLALRSVELPETVEQIGTAAFRSCSSLEEIIFPENLRFIGDHAFDGCTALESIVIPDDTEYIGDGAFFACGSLSDITLPFIGNMREGGEPFLHVFSGLSDEKYTVTVTLASALGADAFNGCARLQAVYLPDTLTDIGTAAFKDCRSLTTIDLPDSLEKIGDEAFMNCGYLSRLTLPGSLRSIGVNAFTDCIRLYEVKNESVLQVEAGDYENGNVGLHALKVYGAEEEMPERETQDGWSFAKIDGVRYLVGYPEKSVLSLPGRTEAYSVAPYLFFNDTEILKLTNTGSAVGIGRSAFELCYELNEVIFTDGVIEIGECAFGNCTSLMRLTLCTTLEEIDLCAFENCVRLYEIWNLSSLPITAGESSYGGVAQNAYYVYDTAAQDRNVVYDSHNLFVRTGTEWMLVSCELTDVVRLPYSFSYDGNTVNGYGIGSGAFANQQIRELYIPFRVNRIAAGAFDDCPELTAIFYDGTQEEWEKMGGYTPPNCQIYFGSF